MRPLSRRFYSRPNDELAPALLGKRLVCRDRVGGRCRVGQIVETEAYLGPDDLASHARFGRTKRNAVMFGPCGVAYVYFIYGMYNMFNIVGREAGAVLVRALAVVDDDEIARGPGKLTRALGITVAAHNGVDLTESDELYVADARRNGDIATGPRIGVGYAGAWAHKRLRFWLEGHPAVSKSR